MTLECTRLYSEGEKDLGSLVRNRCLAWLTPLFSDRVGAMKKLTRSLLFNYVQLLESLARGSEQV